MFQVEATIALDRVRCIVRITELNGIYCVEEWNLGRILAGINETCQEEL